MKEDRRQHHASAELPEGTQYQSGCALLPCTDTTEITPVISFAPLLPTTPCAYVIFDLETSGHDEITQIAAVSHGNVFSQYVLPDSEINKKATETTSLSIRKEKGGRIQAKLGRAVPPVPLPDALSALAK